MEPSNVRYLISIIIIGLGIFYYVNPELAARTVIFKGLGVGKKYIKISGVIMVLLGLYYLLVMLKLIPMIKYFANWSISFDNALKHNK